MAAVIPIHDTSLKKEHYVVADSIDVLTKVYDENINLVIHKREVSAKITQYVDKLLKLEESFVINQIIELNNVELKLKSTLPDSDYRNLFIDDLYTICEMFAVLFDLDKIGLRLSVLEHAMCPRFHVDNVMCRLLTTYGGTGTEWLSEDNLDRNKLGRGNNGLPDEMSGIYCNKNQIHRISQNDISLFKGESWPNNTGLGIVHRSPIVNKTNPRLLLSLDIV